MNLLTIYDRKGNPTHISQQELTTPGGRDWLNKQTGSVPFETFLEEIGLSIEELDIPPRGVELTEK
jgi:hypothetical protein